MNYRSKVILITFYLSINLIFGSYTYNNYGWYSYSDTLSHSEQTSIKYIVRNENNFCSMSCSAKVESGIGSSDSINFEKLN